MSIPLPLGLLSASAAVQVSNKYSNLLGTKPLRVISAVFLLPGRGSFSLLRLGRLVCGQLLFACANPRACCAIVSKNRFLPHRPSTPTIFDCNNLPSVCSF